MRDEQKEFIRQIKEFHAKELQTEEHRGRRWYLEMMLEWKTRVRIWRALNAMLEKLNLASVSEFLSVVHGSPALEPSRAEIFELYSETQ